MNHKSNLILYKTLLVLLGCISLNACHSNSPAEERRENLLKFISYLKENNQQKIYEISYHHNVQNNITNASLRKQWVKAAADMLAKYGIPPESKWQTKSEPSGAVSVIIPLFSGRDTLTHFKESKLVISFPPENISTKVFAFNLFNDYDYGDGPLQAPPSTGN
jgi:hypothetical protein